jgi:hypothetical protein
MRAAGFWVLENLVFAYPLSLLWRPGTEPP